MRYSIVALKDYVRAELLERETVEETRDFLAALAAVALKHGRDRALICVHASRPIFKVEEYHASAYLKELAGRPGSKVALVSSRLGVRAAHEYIEVLARQQGANLRSFSDESPAADWLRAPVGEARALDEARAAQPGQPLR